MKRLIIIALALVGASCSVQRRIEVVSPVEWQIETASLLRVRCEVSNCSSHGVELSSARVRLHFAEGDYATVLLGEPVTIARCATTKVEFPVRVRFADPLNMLAAATPETVPTDKLFVTGEATVRVGGMRKKIRIENRPLSQILGTFAVDY